MVNLNSPVQQSWYALRCTSPSHELRVRDDVRRYGLESFVPLKYEVRRVKGHDRRLLVPAITQYIFVKATLEELEDYIANAHYVVFIQRSTFSGHKDFLTVPAKAMEDFIAVTEHNEQRITYFSPQEIRLNVGDQIRVKGGLYDGREGIIMRVKGKRNRHLVVQIPGILIAAVELSPDMIEMPEKSLKSTVSSLSSNKSLQSKDLDKDRKLVFDLSHRLLFEIPDKYQNENEYYLLRSELSRARDRISSFRGYTPASEAELALPLYMAAVMLSDAEPSLTSAEPVEASEARLRKAIEALKPSSHLRLKCQLYLAILSKDPLLLQEVESKFSLWRQSSLSSNQRSLLEEFSFLQPFISA